jgi:DAACS family dicarboxylate/amino acid:cation (Na+ or H+) symporter
MSAPGPKQSRILIGLVLGAIVGCTVNYLFVPPATPGTPAAVPDWLRFVNENIAQPIGQIFLRLLFVTVVPLVFASLAVGVSQIGSMGAVGRVGAKTLAYFLVSMTIAAIIGLALVNAVRPGEGLPPEARTQLEKQFGGEASKKKPADYTVMTFVESMLPRNPVKAASDLEMLGIITFALLVGIGITKLAPPKAELMTRFLEAVGELMVFIIQWAMVIAPVGVFCLIFTTTSLFGFGLLKLLGGYVAVALGGLAIQAFVVFPILIKLLTGMNPIEFFSKARTSIITAFSTSSSNATLPTNIRTAEDRFGIHPRIAAFVLPLGATMCMAGTALFEGVTVLFLAQVMGVQLDLASQIIVVVLCVLTAVGAAGVPGGSIPLLMTVLASRGIPPESIALILGVDRILDMCRTTVNNIGDLSAVLVVAKSEGAIGDGAATPAGTAS